MPVPSVTYPTIGDNFARSLLKWNQILFNRGGFSVATPFTTLAPTHGDTIESSLQKINAILFQRGGFTAGQLFATLAPTHGDTKETSARKINQILFGGGGTLQTVNPPPHLDYLDPASAPSGSSFVMVIANGSGFVDGAVMVARGTDLATHFESPTQLTAQAFTPGAAGQVPVQIRNPDNQLSNTVNFNVT